MKELDDKDFDQLFKSKITESYPEFEEQSWLLMEKKLRRKDLLVFYRNASIILLFLSFGIGLYLINHKNPAQPVIQTKHKAQEKVTPAPIIPKSDFPQRNPGFNHEQPLLAATVKTHQNSLSVDTNIILNTNELAVPDSSIPKLAESSAIELGSAIQHPPITQSTALKLSQNSKQPFDPNSVPEHKKSHISVAINFGPDFSSTAKLIGGKGNIALGMALNLSLSKKLSLQSGVNYGTKSYQAKSYEYTFKNPKSVYSIEEIDALCKVLEVPLRLSFLAVDREKTNISLNAGLSSYFMLKENYRFQYTAAAGGKERFVEERNANQHYLSVVDLSATYYIKLKDKNLGLGLEPYVKIPLSGIGEGRVPLKSSGISLKLRYDFHKK